MKPRRALSFLTGVALLAAIAKFNEVPAHAQASLLDAAAETARTTVRSLLSAAVATYNEVTRNTAQQPLRVSVPRQGKEGGNGVPPPVVGQADLPPGNPLWALPLEQLSNTRERPIFSPSRRPPPPTPAYVAPVTAQQPVKPPEPERPTVSLVGTIIGAGDDRLGVFIDSSTHGVVRLRIGEDHQGWVVRLINTREAILVKDGQPAVALALPPPGQASPKLSSRDALLDQVWKVGAE